MLQMHVILILHNSFKNIFKNTGNIFSQAISTLLLFSILQKTKHYDE